MTALNLLAYIATALLLQIAVSIAIAFRKLRHNHNTFHNDKTDADDPVDSTVSTSDKSPDIQYCAWQGVRKFRVIQREYEDSAQTVCSFYLEPVDALPLPHFLAGQFVTICLQLKDLKMQNKIVTRCYSLSNPPGLKSYRISIKRALSAVNSSVNFQDALPGLVSNYFHDHIHQGDIISLQSPNGQFYIDTRSTGSVVMIAGGIGITPLLSMLLWCIEQQPTRVIHFYYGVKNSQEQAFKTLLENLATEHANVHLHVVYSNPATHDDVGADHQHSGYIDIARLRRTLPSNEQQFYVCGPSAMMTSLIPELIEWGVRRESIHYEAFGPATVPAAPITDDTQALTSAEVKFQKSARTLIWDGRDQNLLDFAERNGIAIEAGCRAGSCGCCETKVLSGSVSYDVKPEYHTAFGHCLLCVGRPSSALVLQA